MLRVSLDEGSHFMLASRFNKANLKLCDGSFSPSRAKTHTMSALRLSTWVCVLRETSFVVAATISSPFKWHQTGGTLFQTYKRPSVQVLHLIHRRSQTADRPRMEISKWFFMFFYSLFKWLVSLISLRPDGFKSPLLLNTWSPLARHTSRFLAPKRALVVSHAHYWYWYSWSAFQYTIYGHNVFFY